MCLLPVSLSDLVLGIPQWDCSRDSDLTKYSLLFYKGIYSMALWNTGHIKKHLVRILMLEEMEPDS